MGTTGEDDVVVVDLRHEHSRVADGFVCPNCWASRFEAVTDGKDVNFLCMSCGLCWHVELGYVRRVDPVTCRGCARHEECLAREFGRRLVERATTGGRPRQAPAPRPEVATMMEELGPEPRGGSPMIPGTVWRLMASYRGTFQGEPAGRR